MCSKARCSAIGTRVRVNAQLIDAETGAHLWADRFEEEIADLFKLQDQVVARLGNSVGSNSSRRKRRRPPVPKTPTRSILPCAGEPCTRANTDEGGNEAARALFEQALEIDPNNAGALAGDAETYFNEYGRKLMEINIYLSEKRAYEAKILGQADRAIVLAPNTVATLTR